MRDGWAGVTLGQISEISSGSRAKGGAIQSGIPSIGGEQISEDRSIKFYKMKFVPKNHFDKMVNGKLLKGDSLLVKDGATTGKLGYWPYDMPAAVNEHVFILRARNGLVEPFFLNLLLCNPDFRREIESRTRGIIGGINRDIQNIEFTIPLVPEQKRISDLISSVDSYIQAVQKQLENAKTSRDAVLNGLLSLNGDDWYETELSEVTSLITDGSHFSPKTSPSGAHYVTVRDIKEGFLDIDNAARISEEAFLELEKNGCRPLFGDILFSKDGTVGKVALVQTRERFVVLSSLAIVRADDARVLPKFLKLTMSAERFQRDAIGSKTGLAIKRIVLKHLKTLKVPIPPIAFQKKVIDDMAFFDSHLESLTKMISASKSMRASLLNVLLSGEYQIPASYDKVMDRA